ncbi:alkaline phosphatase family protein [Deinococcus sp. KNUC1210]|uniref:alkaline phosphatase family protein n=1 Tax=Deinococcus sp. KNUC1210 TaxID=2917691 RepID=UPI001EF03DAD|nr:alkaline phosphatase family protein [Deinococcus sp. KNUC1210]ULH15669.1 alkaline phosphatase family protein [Deinococcus sp. KNUC1210]
MPRLLFLPPLLLTAALAAPAPTLQHVFVFVLENHSLKSVIGNPNLPTLNRLASTYGYAANYTGVVHPSLPNYVAMIAGDTMGMAGDNPEQRFSGDHLALQLETAGLSWRGYMQGLPKAGSTANYAGNYGKKHNPFMLSAETVGSEARRMNVVPYEQFGTDLASGNIPNFAFLVPDLCHDMHGALKCLSRAALDRTGDAFIGTWTQKIMASGVWKSGAAIVITFDEGAVAIRQVGAGASPPLSSRRTAHAERSVRWPTTITRCCERWKRASACRCCAVPKPRRP